MKTIEIDDEIYGLLEGSVKGFNETPNDVLRRLLAATNHASSPTAASRSSLRDYLDGASFQFWGGNAKKRYLGLLAFLHDQDPTKFAQFEGYGRGRRIQISKTKSLIEGSGSSTFPEKIGKTDYYAVTNLPNALKRTIISDLMRAYSFPKEDVAAACQALSDRG